MARVCIRHPFILSENLCGRCGAEFCRDCLVFPASQKLPLCVTCAVSASGVRRRGAPQPLSGRKLRALRNERNRDVQPGEPQHLPEIANPIPAGWAFEDPPADEPERAPEPPKRRRYRDAPGRRIGSRSIRANRSLPEPSPVDAAELTGEADAEEPSMVSWLDDVYAPKDRGAG